MAAGLTRNDYGLRVPLEYEFDLLRADDCDAGAGFWMTDTWRGGSGCGLGGCTDRLVFFFFFFFQKCR